ncbi:ABC transporter permease [uncultured Hyphomicrobium sp.]|uniref:cell division protein FtsX n=1 Tax=uncultured Hyphomicrobium sp. TaxID=194373 RepID=UPI0025E7B93E|nr:ABC transporter permease [uncultured Hyphomicrobium sp.]
MSGSYDRPDRPPMRGLDPHRVPEYDPYDDLVTQGGRATTQARTDFDRNPYEPDPISAGDAALRSEYERHARPDMYAPPPREARKVESLTAPIVPAGSVTGRSLTLVITIMCFLACLTVGAVYMIRQSANAWLKDIASEVTVQVQAKDGTDTDKIAQDVATYLGQQSGIAKVTLMSAAESAALLEPWLGQIEDLNALPLPRLIALELDRNAAPDLDKVRAGLSSQFQGATLDDHRRWQQQIATITNSFALGGLAILALVAMATTAIIVSATKSSMASNREIVEVLHFVGATDRFIAREFEKHFLRLGVRAGLVGAVLALAVFLLMPGLVQIMGGGAMTLTELHRLLGSGALDTAGFVLMGIVVVVIAALCMLTSRFGVFRILNSKH